MFQTSVFPIPPGAKRTVTLRYSQALPQAGRPHRLPSSRSARPSTPPARSRSSAFASDDRKHAPIKNVYSPTHAVNIERPDNKHAVVNYDATKIVPGDDFRLLFDSGDGSVGASVVSYRPKANDDGYFLLLASPEIKCRRAQAPVAKTVVFVVDRSGSMSGKKIEQAKGALKFVLNNLREGDMFNIVAYDSAIETFRPELQKFNDETRKAALGFVEGLYAGGSTNIDGALHRALDLLTDSSRPELRPLPHRRPAHRRRNQRNEDRNQLQSKPTRFTPGCSPSASATTSTAGCSTRWPARTSARANTSGPTKTSKPRQQALRPHRLAGDDRRIGYRRRRWHDASDATPAVNRIYPKDAIRPVRRRAARARRPLQSQGKAKVTLTGTVGDEETTFDFPATSSTKATTTPTPSSRSSGPCVASARSSTRST